jgi:iron complex transport system ATP-binding protein
MKRRGPPLLEFRNVTLVRGGRRVLDGITLAVGVGENIALVGPNGSGKSSFIKLLTRELYPFVNDDAVSSMKVLGRERWDLFALRRHLGIVSLDLQADFAREMTGFEAVLSGFFSSVGLWHRHRVTREMEKKAVAILERLEAFALADRPMTEMSTGEARRMLIGRALVHGADTLVLDEPTNSLDLRAVREFRDTLQKLSRSGTSVILVTHHLEDLFPEIRRTVLLREGKVFRDGATVDVLTTPNLTELFRMPVRVERKDGYYRLC